MTKDALQVALDYIDDTGCPAQITHTNGDWYIDFQTRNHAEVCALGLKDMGHYNTHVLATAYHMRVT